MLPCHATDRNAPLYGGKWTTAKEGRICAGLTILAQREIRHFMECGMQREKYAATKGHRFTLKALAMWASMLHFTGHQIVAGSNCLTIPETEPDDRVALPWPDPVQHATD